VELTQPTLFLFHHKHHFNLSLLMLINFKTFQNYFVSNVITHKISLIIFNMVKLKKLQFTDTLVVN
jgi:hypothetical protein